MDDNILMIAISGDGNEKEGLATFMLELGQDKATIIKLDSEENSNKLNDLLMLNMNKEYDSLRVYHINAFKDYIRNTRSYIYSERFLEIFNQNNEAELFTLFAKSGNVIIQNTGHLNIVYLPKYMSDNVRNSMIEMEKYINEKSRVELIQITKDDKIEQDIFRNYNEFIKSKFNITK